MKKLKIFLTILIILLIPLIVIVAIYVDDVTIDFEYFEFDMVQDHSKSLKIAHISDTHFPNIHVDIDYLVETVNAFGPDIIAITGDIVGTRSTIESSGVIEFVERLVEIAPTFYVNGNHEVRNVQRQLLYAQIINAGAIFLQNEYKRLVINNIPITIIGLLDDEPLTNDLLNEDMKDDFILLLAHRPDVFDTATNDDLVVNPDLILAGHVHGGQVRMFGSAIFCPDQLFFPRFSNGLYLADNQRETKMIVSRGLGNSIIPFRFNNLAHIPLITINK